MELSAFTSFTWTFLGFTALWLITTLWLNVRQRSAAKHNVDNIPPELSEVITTDDAKKASAYAQKKLSLHSIGAILSIIVLLMWTLIGGLEVLSTTLDAWLPNIGAVVMGVVVIISFSIISSIIDLPLGLYRTFGIEAQFGFNNTTLKTYISDIIKSAIVGLIIGVPLLLALLYIMEQMGALWWLWAWLLISGFSLLMLAIYPKFIAPLFNTFEPLENTELAQKINTLLTQAGFKSNGLYIMDGSKRSSHGNAYFTGFGANKRIVFFDTLLKGMNDNEVLAVLAHELGHFHHKHIIKQLSISFATTFVGLYVLGVLIQMPEFFTSLGVTNSAYHTNHIGLILFMMIVPIFTFFITPLMNLASRTHEYEADAFAVKHTNGADLITALTKLYRDNAAITVPDSVYSTFYDSHPNAVLRIAHINAQHAKS